jgi:N-acetylglutamate synthase-like GNAT family acetyltransferase
LESLLGRVLEKAREVELLTLYLRAFDQNVVGYYEKLGWHIIDFAVY